ncbi:DUF1926 domain-containing protein [bacterium]|nr:DUF1926 domain-containing protein [bacterium]
MEKIKFIIILHNHQPVGNFDWVFKDAAEDAYAPFLDVLERHPGIRVGIHTTGPLLEWFEEQMPGYLDRLAALVEKGQVEIIGGGFYEPILSILPDRDKAGQLDMMNRWVERRFGKRPAGCWVAERIWEPGFASVLGSQGLLYTTLDNTHFQYAGIPDDRIWGSYVTEDQGIPLRVLPIDYLLRYYIPFHDPQETIDYIGSMKEKGATAVTYADDGEKFGVWPGTKIWVYEKGWLERFFTALEENAHWIDIVLPGDYVSAEPPLGSVYLPTASYKEMSEWSLPVAAQKVFQSTEKELEGDKRFEAIKPFIRGGFWRNFIAKYPETDAMYRRMLIVSEAVEKARGRDEHGEAVRELYRGQCNCGYWHGVFGGLYLNFLRRAIYEHLIKAENLVRKSAPAARVTDYNGDGYGEVVLSNNALCLFLAPHEGGAGLEFDSYRRSFNLFDTMTRREEAYHSLIPAVIEDEDPEKHASIHDGIKAKDKNIHRYLHYDWYRRLSFVDHFIPSWETIDAFADSKYREYGDFVALPYEVEEVSAKPSPNVRMARSGGLHFDGCMVPVRVEKRIALPGKGSSVTAAYSVHAANTIQDVLFGVEMNFGLQSGSSDDSGITIPGRTLADSCLASKGEEPDVTEITLRVGWMPLTVKITFSKPAKLWRLPIETVSQSEGGVEHNYQNTCIVPLWSLQTGDSGLFDVEITMEVK